MRRSGEPGAQVAPQKGHCVALETVRVFEGVCPHIKQCLQHVQEVLVTQVSAP